MRSKNIARAGVMACGIAGALCLWGCQSAPKDVLVAPGTLVSPYDTSRGEVLWAVAPLRNESGTTEADIGRLSDSMVAAAEEIRGVRCLPLNRTLAAMDALKMTTVSTPGEAKRLAEAMGVDGVLVGTVTAYDAYTPVIGVTAGLYARPGAMALEGGTLNPRVVTTSPTEAPAPRGAWKEDPVTVVSVHLDGKNNQVLMDLKSYADGRMDRNSALGWRRYAASAALYGEFAAYRVMSELMSREWIRLGTGTPVAGAGEAGR